MTYEAIVEYAKKKVAAANLKTYKGHLATQVDITGEGEGAFYIELTDGNADVQPYEYKDFDIKLVASADVFTAILDGKKSAEDAYANGELTVVGDVAKALELSNLLKKKAPAKKAAAKPAAKKTTAKKAPAKKAATAKKAAAKPAAKKATTAKKTAAKPAAKKATTAKKTTAKPAAKKAVPAKKAEVKPAVEAKPVEKAAPEAKKAAVATAKKNVSKKVTTK